jgi:hypothetical protein
MKPRAALLLAAWLLQLSSTSRAGEETITGDATVGWRFIEDEDDGRFPQDQNLEGGFRLFRLSLGYEDPSLSYLVDEAELEITGAGDPSSDYLATLRRSGILWLRGGYRRDDYSYRATGDPFPYDTLRERSHVKGRLTPLNDLVVRFGWDRSSRRGDALASALTEAREVPAGGDVDDIVQDRRRFDRTADTWNLGADWGIGPLRLGLTESIRIGVLDDDRSYSIPEDATPVRETLGRDLRTKAYTTVGKVGATLLDGRLDATLFVSYTRLFQESRLSGSIAGFDNVFSGGAPRGPFSSTVGGGTRARRSVRSYRLESAYQAHPDLELTLGAETETAVDDISRDLTENRSFDDPAVPSERREDDAEVRVTYRTQRASLDAVWDIEEDLRLRLGEEYYAEQLEVPNATPGADLEGTDLRATTFRHTVGLDAEPVERLSLSLLLRYFANKEPHSAVSAETAEEVSFRARYRADERLFLSAVYRRKAFHRSDERDSDTSSDSVSGSAVWSEETMGASLTATYQAFATRTDTVFFDLDRSVSVPVRDRVDFHSRDLILDLSANAEVTPACRVEAAALLTWSRGDYEALTRVFSIGAEYDLRAELMAGLTLRNYRLDETGRGVDDYNVNALEVTLTYRF